MRLRVRHPASGIALTKQNLRHAFHAIRCPCWVLISNLFRNCSCTNVLCGPLLPRAVLKPFDLESSQRVARAPPTSKIIVQCLLTPSFLAQDAVIGLNPIENAPSSFTLAPKATRAGRVLRVVKQVSEQNHLV